LNYLFNVYREIVSTPESEVRNNLQLTIYDVLQKLMLMLTRPCLHSVHESTRNRASLTEKIGKVQDFNPSVLESEMSDSQSARSGKSAEATEQPISNLAQLLLPLPRLNPVEKSICTSVNKHLVMDLYLSTTRKIMDASSGLKTKNQITSGWPSANDLIKDVQKNISAIIQDDLTREDFEEAFIYDKLARLLGPVEGKRLPKSPIRKDEEEEEIDEGTTTPLIKLPPNLQKASQTNYEATCSDQFKKYPKLSKFLRILTILMLQASTRSSNKDLVMMNILLLLKNISVLFKNQEPIPFDQITLCLDVMNK